MRFLKPDKNRTMRMPRILTAAFFLLVGLTVSAGQAASPEVYGGTLVSASIAEPSNFIPFMATDSASHEICSKVFNGLVKYNPSLELEGDLAESWEILDEGTTIVFHLRRDVVWHDLEPFTAADVEFTFRKLTDPELPSPYKGDFERVEKFEVVDPYTVRISYGEPFSPALSSWGMSIVPGHLLENEDLLRTPFIRHPVGTGPYRFRRWVSGNRVELVAFDRYFEGRPKIDRMVFRVVPDQTTMFLELHQETVDIMGLNPLQYKRQTGGAFFETTFRKFRYPSFGYTYLGLNLKRPMFEDVRVRRALNYAINKQEVIDGVFLGLARVANGPFPPESWANDPGVNPAPFDPQKARALLKETGWEDHDGDGVLDRGGKRFEFTIVTNQGNLQRQQTCEIIQRRLGEQGIIVKIKIVEWSAFLKEYVDKRDFDAVMLAWNLSRDPDPFDIWHSSKTVLGGFNFVHYKNEEVDRLIEEGRRTFDPEKRRAAYQKINRIIYDEQPYIFLYFADSLPIVHRRFKNVEATPIGLMYNLIDWEVPPKKRKYTAFRP